MSYLNYRAPEALYLIIVREQNAEQLLKKWAESHKANVTIENNRMKLFEINTLNLFQIKWPHSWHNVCIWDCWNRKHITLGWS